MEQSALGVFAKLRKATIRFAMPARPSFRLSVRMEQLVSHWTDCCDILYVSVFRNLSKILKFY
jgi:hypothetical protein